MHSADLFNSKQSENLWIFRTCYRVIIQQRILEILFSALSRNTTTQIPPKTHEWFFLWPDKKIKNKFLPFFKNKWLIKIFGKKVEIYVEKGLFIKRVLWMFWRHKVFFFAKSFYLGWKSIEIFPESSLSFGFIKISLI